MKNIKPFFYRMKYYFLRGHQSWWYIPLMLASIFVVLYGIGGTVMPWIYEMFPTIYGFALISVPIYIIICILTGRWDFKTSQGAFQVEQSLWWEDNPLLEEIREIVKEEISIDPGMKQIKEKLDEIFEYLTTLKRVEAK